MANFNRGWYLIYTRPRSEKKVAERLSEKEIMHYLPTIKGIRKWNDRRKLMETPLFPSYLFVYLDSLQQYYESLEAEGVLYYVKFGRQIAKVEESLIQNLKILLEKGEELEVSTQYFQPCDVLMITDGSLAGLTCEVVKTNGKRRILVRVKMLNRVLMADLPLSYLVKAS